MRSEIEPKLISELDPTPSERHFVEKIRVNLEEIAVKGLLISFCVGFCLLGTAPGFKDNPDLMQNLNKVGFALMLPPLVTTAGFFIHKYIDERERF